MMLSEFSDGGGFSCSVDPDDKTHRRFVGIIGKGVLGETERCKKFGTELIAGDVLLIKFAQDDFDEIVFDIGFEEDILKIVFADGRFFIGDNGTDSFNGFLKPFFNKTEHIYLKRASKNR